MEFSDITIISIAISSVLLIFSLYLLIQLRFKRKEGKTLYKKNEALLVSIDEQEKMLEGLIENVNMRNLELKHLLELEENENKMRNNLENSKTQLSTITNDIETLEKKGTEISENIVSIKEDISIYQPILGLMNVGFFDEPDYLFETSERFKEEIKIIREQQKSLIKEKKALFIPDTIALTSNKTYVKKILTGQCKLMLKAFNVECDNLMSKVKPSNYAKILERIDKVAADLEKSTASLMCGFTKEYVELEFKECEVQYQFKLKDAREKEEQAVIKEQIREEQKAIREFERAIAKAQKEERMYRDALEAARNELAVSSAKDKDKLNKRIALPEKQLLEAENNEKRAKSMAEQTRRGHVYIISNIGSFGENIYKIGLTRRLEPMDRVKELGDASVPFTFDVHAMIFSENAPELETKLHKEFTHFRVNQMNHRKEFFNVTLLDIKEKAIEVIGNEIDFKMTALAEDYYETLKLRSEFVES